VALPISGYFCLYCKMYFVKKWMLTLLFIAGSLLTMAQAPDTPAFKKNPVVPSLYLLQADSTTFTQVDMKHQPTLIMYFSPTCDHCQHQWEDMVKHKEALQHIQIIMATYQPFDEMKDFYKKENIASYPNIKMGRDEKFGLPGFFRMRSLPFQALYDRDGKLITTFEGNVKVEKLLEAFNGK
jgi:thioredoxin-related protein